ncbi:MAG TPA: class II glutamine amidotransferase, partial [Acetivibrio sp.]|nr:class II glutamine amidotransferase [Acetivibrio sp.]
LLCYHDKDGYNGLCFVQRKSPYGMVKLVDEDWEVNLAEGKTPDQGGLYYCHEKTNKSRALGRF